MPFCRIETRNWLNDLLGSLTTTTQGRAGNASTEEIFGVELDLNFQITQNWSLRANYGYIDAE